MFGYVKPYVPELKIKEYECFRAVYCGLCRAMGKISGQMSRLTLSYDFVFFVMMRMALTGEKPEFEEFRCPVHFTKKRQYMRLSEGSAYSAVLSSVLAKEKNSDDLNDEKGTKHLKALLLSPFFTHFLAKSKKNRKYEYREEFGTETSKLLYELGKLENEGCQSLDETAEAFGNLLAYILSFGLEDETAAIAREIGMATGRFVYVCDAADDLADDVKKNRYNPIYAGWGDIALEDGRISHVAAESIKISLPIDLEKLGEAVEKLNGDHVFVPIIKNIVYLGMPSSLERVIEGGKKKEEKSYR